MAGSLQSLALRLTCPVLACLLSASCQSLVDSLAYDERPLPNDPELTPVVRDAVVPELQVLIGSEGLFRYPIPNVAVGEMPLDTALAQAVLFLDYAQNTWWRLTAEGERGAFIEMGKLTPCGQIHLVRSKYESLPDSVHQAFRTRLGDQWSIPFCGGYKGPDVVVTVAAAGNATRFVDGRPIGKPTVITGGLQGTEFVVRGLPWWWGVEHFVTAEEAVNEVFAHTGIRVRALPELLRGENSGAERINGRTLSSHVACSAWRVSLERAVRVQTPHTNRTLEVTDLYVADSDCPGPLGRSVLSIPWPVQPTTREYTLILPDSTATFGRRTFVYPTRLRAPVDFETVIIVR